MEGGRFRAYFPFTGRGCLFWQKVDPDDVPAVPVASKEMLNQTPRIYPEAANSKLELLGMERSGAGLSLVAVGVDGDWACKTFRRLGSPLTFLNHPF